MTYKELREIAHGLQKADPTALFKMDVVTAVDNMGVDIDEQTDIEGVCRIVTLKYNEYLKTKWAYKDVDDFCYAIGKWLDENQDKSSHDIVCDLSNADWDWIFSYTSEMD